MGLTNAMCGEWRLLKYVQEAEFGPDTGVNTVLIITSLESKPEALQGLVLHFLLMFVSRNLPDHQTHHNSSCALQTPVNGCPRRVLGNCFLT